jgi:hypothetical protein
MIPSHPTGPRTTPQAIPAATVPPRARASRPPMPPKMAIQVTTMSKKMLNTKFKTVTNAS